MEMPDFLKTERGYNHVALLLSSYQRWVGRPLLPVGEDSVQALFEASFALVSHGVEADPILNYGNRRALELWETSWEELTRTPSRLTAEPVAREERERLLERVTRDGFISDYQGVRISQKGRRFLIQKATVWNLVDAGNVYRGQAAVFSEVTFL